jgi:hypothetical protein
MNSQRAFAAMSLIVSTAARPVQCVQILQTDGAALAAVQSSRFKVQGFGRLTLVVLTLRYDLFGPTQDERSFLHESANVFRGKM